jgi:hypothetical protein
LICVPLLLAATACSSGGEKAEDKPTTSAGTSAGPEETLPDLTPAQVVRALSGKSYKCTTDEAYQTCAQGTSSVQVLIGTQPRPAVLSLQTSGAAAAATTQLTELAPQVLETAHVNPRAQITDWLKQQGTAGVTKAGIWTVEFSTESDTEQPGAILTLTDTTCTVNCGAE